MQNEKLFWADNLRVVATISVIILHVSAPVIPNNGLSANWWVGNISESSVRFSVPIFFMLTGAFLLDKEYEVKDFLKKRFFRVILPFLFWSIPYILFDLALKFSHGERLTLTETISFTIKQFQTGTYYHLWFVYTLLGIYLFIPIIGKWIRTSSQQDMLYFLGIWLITVLASYPLVHKLKIDIDLSYFTGFLGYLILGYYLRIVNFKSNKVKDLVSIILFTTGLVITIVGTYVLYKLKGELDELFYGYLTLNVLMSSIGVFLFIKDKTLTNNLLIKIRDFINKFSYGIYLVHVLVLAMLNKAGLTAFTMTNPIIGISITTVVCLLLSSLIIYIVSKLPFGKYISG